MNLTEIAQADRESFVNSPRCLMVKALISNSERKNRFSVGRNDESMRIWQAGLIDGLLESAGQQTQWQGIPIVSPGQIDKSAVIFNCSTSIRPVDTLEWLSRSGFSNIINYFELSYVYNESISSPAFVSNQIAEIKSNERDWIKIFENLADEESRKTLLDVLSYRLTANPVFMQDYKVRTDRQYLEDFMEYGDDIFVDAGGFDGDTAESFSKYSPDYKKIIIFEPSAHNMAKLRNRIAGIERVEVHPIGLSDKKEKLYFNSALGSACNVDSNGTESIFVDTLDSVVQEPVTFIKMDLEGWEMQALRGARQHIENNAPKMAIAVYHNAADIRTIYQLVHSLNSRYSTYMRHYTQGWSETVMFFKRND